mmetsp:Transcript_27723/g.76704  ORF Transcript_27723/g.76704 Transcript_27723/m.76704 type:complete len:275 (-) Transcript_27723:14-838(-)
MSRSSRRAGSHRSAFSHALMALLHGTTFNSRPEQRPESRAKTAGRQRPPSPNAPMVAPTVMASVSTRLARISPANSRARNHRSSVLQVLMAMLYDMASGAGQPQRPRCMSLKSCSTCPNFPHFTHVMSTALHAETTPVASPEAAAPSPLEPTPRRHTSSRTTSSAPAQQRPRSQAWIAATSRTSSSARPRRLASPSNPSARCHCRLLSQADMTAVYVTTSGSQRRRSMSASNSNASTHRSDFSHTLIAALYAMLFTWTLACRASARSASARCHC